MKMISILVFAGCLHATASGYSQEVSFNFSNAPLEKVFKEIERQTKFRFIYSEETLAQSLPVTIEVKNESIQKVLKRSFEHQPLNYSIEESFIFVKASRDLPNRNFLDISGKVVNEKGEGVGGITVTIKGTDKIVITDNSGGFKFNTVPEAGTLLLISGAEIESQEIKADGNPFIVVHLKSKITELDQLMVIGYGQTTRRFGTGSVTRVGADIINQQPISNPLAALEGRVPGLVVTSTSGLPGSSFNIQIRGQNSINPNPNSIFNNPQDNPLFIIDGVPFAPQNSNINLFPSLAAPGSSSLYGNAYGGISPFSLINPSDIESIDVLRDADATAIYGSRGANGVILITTKKGKIGATKFNISVNTGISKVTRTMSMMNTNQYLTMRREALTNDGITPSLDPYDPGYAPDLLSFDAGKYTDWKKYFLGGTAQSTDINASISGGSNSTQFLMGTGYNHQSYVLPGDLGYDRISFNVNLRHTSVNRRFTIEFSGNYAHDQNNSSGSLDVLQAFILPPNNPDLLTAGGVLIWNYNNVQIKNPLGGLKQKYFADNNNLISHVQINYEIIPGLTVRTSFGYNTLNGSETKKTPKSAQNPANFPTAYTSFGQNGFESWIIEPQAEYNKNISKGRLTVLAGGTLQQTKNSNNSASGYGYSSDLLLGSISSAAFKTISDGYSEYKYDAAFARINYIWRNKYMMNFNGRRDGSSRFGPGKQFGNFGSVAAGWIFSEESILKKALPFLSFGKLRASYGTTGNDNIGDYQFLSRWATTSQILGLSFLGSNGYVPQNLYNPSFSWSVTRKLETSLDIGLFKDRLLINVSWYRHKSGNQLITYPLPLQTGFSGITKNFPALVENKGWEFSLIGQLVKSHLLGWTSTFNLTVPSNKLLSFSGIETSSYSQTYVVGQSLNVLRKFKLTGVNSETGVYEFQTKNGNSSYPDITVDPVVIGNADPKFYGGLNNSFSYKHFQLDIFIEFKKQLGANYLQTALSLPAGYLQNQPVPLLDRWQRKDDNKPIEEFTADLNSPASYASSMFIQSDGAYSDASYIRLKTFSLSYAIDSKWLKKIHLETCRFYVNSQNILTVTKYKGNDPETQSFYSIPPLKTIVAGILITI